MDYSTVLGIMLLCYDVSILIGSLIKQNTAGVYIKTLEFCK